MNYSIKEIAGIIKASGHIVCDMPIAHLLTDSRAVSVPESTLFFAFRQKPATATGTSATYTAWECVTSLFRVSYRSINKWKRLTSLSSRTP